LTGSPWAQVSDIATILRKRWDRGQYVSGLAAGGQWEPISLPVRSPTATDVLTRLDDVRRWLAKWERDSRGPGGCLRLRTEYRTVASRAVGANQLPVRAWLDTPEQLCELIGTTENRHALDEVLMLTQGSLPALRDWVVLHPLVAIANRHIWERVLASLDWVTTHDTASLYLRQLDVEGVDTKFLERNYKLIEQLLIVLAPERANLSAPDIARRLGFQARPDYVRLRFLGLQPEWPAAVTEARLRADELPGARIVATTVFIVENEVSYLAFPAVPASIVMFGSGYALEPAYAGEWLDGKDLVYWGDIDTHGFAILNNLRHRYPKVASILMDGATLLAHPHRYTEEAVPTSRVLRHLNPSEALLYQDLVEDRYGHAVRLEQERIRFSMVREALRPWAG
jgi:hypothetical protein